MSEECISPNEMQQKLRGLPVAVVQMGSQIKLAITQELIDPPLMLCWAYVLIGFLPPIMTIELLDLYSRIDPFILNACQRTIDVVSFQCYVKTQTIDQLLRRKVSISVNNLPV